MNQLEPWTIASVIKGACSAQGDQLFIKDECQELTGTKMRQHILAVAASLRARGVTKGNVAAFLCESSVSHTVAMFGCLISGVVSCCLHIRETQNRNRTNVEAIQAKVLFTDPDLIDDAQAIVGNRKETEIISLGAEPADMGIDGNLPSMLAEFTGQASSALVTTPALDDPALLVLSSGTTGRAKFVLHSQGTLAATARYGPDTYGCESASDSTIVFMHPSFAAWIHTVLPFIAIQGRVVFGTKFDGSSFLTSIESEKLTMAPLVPTAWRMVLAANPENFDLSSLRTAFFSGEPGSESLVHSLRERICSNVMTSYLAAEGGCASGIVAGSKILLLPGKASSTGKPVRGAELKIIDPEGEISDDLPPGEIGEIALKSASIGLGYFGNADLTHEKFMDGWWRSGDLGCLDEEGLLFVKGRLDNRINTGGVKVHAEDIETALLKHPDIRFAAVVGESDQTWGERIEAHLVSENPALTSEEVMEFCASNGLLPAHFLPKAVHFHDTLPTGPTGKLYRRGLKSNRSLGR